MANLLDTRNLSKKYQMGEITVNALCDVDFGVRQGEFVAIMGPSGSGKSTLLHLMGGLDTPSNGEITLAGKRLARLTDDEITIIRRRQIGFIFQFFNLLPTLSAGENLALPLLIDGKRREEHEAKIDELLRLVGLSDRKHHKPDQLSGGQQQRVAIARALVTEPAIVLADEPTGNLDSKSSTEILDLLRHACDRQGQTIVMVTHDARAAAYADRIVFLQDGKIVRQLKSNSNNHSTQKIMDVMAQLEL